MEKKRIDASKLTIDSKTKIYIGDLDFDKILEIKNFGNLFYLEKYSIRK
jgi:hypothetical protein